MRVGGGTGDQENRGGLRLGPWVTNCKMLAWEERDARRRGEQVCQMLL